MLAPLAAEAVITGFLEAAGREEGGRRCDEARDRRAGRRFSFSSDVPRERRREEDKKVGRNKVRKGHGGG